MTKITKAVVIATPDKKLDSRLKILEKMVGGLVVINQESYDTASGMLVKIKQAISEAEEALNPQCEATYHAWQVALTQKKKYVDPYKMMEKTIKGQIGNYELGQEKIRREEEERLQIIIKEQEEREKAKLLKRAEKAGAKGNVEKAEELREQAEMVFIPTPQLVSTTIQKTKGVSSRIDYDVEVVDMMILIKAIANGEITINIDRLFTVKAGILKDYVTMTGKKSVPGCVIKEKAIISASGRG
jgi:hypothetical protein